jgi:CheY-like chemotaxis protein
MSRPDRYPYIILAEDNFDHATRLRQKLEREFANGETYRIKTEHEFRSKLEDFVQKPPDVIVLDVMLNWTLAGPNMVDSPDDVSEGGYHRAGFRCIKKLAEHPTTQKIPCIIYTVLAHSALDDEFAELPPGMVVEYLQKDSEPTRLFNLIRKLTRRGKDTV